MPDTSSINAYLVTADEDGHITAGLTTLTTDQLPDQAIEIAVEWSSLHFKATLAAAGNRRVAGNLPHVPGIDAAGTVVAADHG